MRATTKILVVLLVLLEPDDSPQKVLKQPIKRLEPTLHKFIKVALPTDLERLNRHKLNMEKVGLCGSIFGSLICWYYAMFSCKILNQSPVLQHYKGLLQYQSYNNMKVQIKLFNKVTPPIFLYPEIIA